MAGDRAAALDKLRAMEQRYGDAAMYQYAEIYAQLGMADEAIAALDRAFDLKATPAWPTFESIRSWTHCAKIRVLRQSWRSLTSRRPDSIAVTLVLWRGLGMTSRHGPTQPRRRRILPAARHHRRLRLGRDERPAGARRDHRHYGRDRARGRRLALRSAEWLESGIDPFRTLAERLFFNSS